MPTTTPFNNVYLLVYSAYHRHIECGCFHGVFNQHGSRKRVLVGLGFWVCDLAWESAVDALKNAGEEEDAIAYTYCSQV
jgi:hypothetical protein